MKVLIAILITVIISMGTLLKVSFDKSLEFRQKFKNLTSKTIKLEKNNKKLAKQQEKIKNKIKERRKKITKRNLKRAERKIGKAAASMVPYIGIPVIVGTATLEINEYCEDIKEMKKFENDLFGNLENNDSQDQEKLCGMNIEEELKPLVEQQYEDSKEWIDKSFDKAIDLTKRKIDELLQKSE